MQSRAEALRIISRWEDMMENPVDYAPICQCCGNPIDEPYRLGGRLYCSDCAHEMCRKWLDDDETIECEGCGETIADEDCYYDVGINEPYCSECFEKYFKE